MVMAAYGCGDTRCRMRASRPGRDRADIGTVPDEERNTFSSDSLSAGPASAVVSSSVAAAAALASLAMPRDRESVGRAARLSVEPVVKRTARWDETAPERAAVRRKEVRTRRRIMIPLKSFWV